MPVRAGTQHFVVAAPCHALQRSVMLAGRVARTASDTASSRARRGSAWMRSIWSRRRWASATLDFGAPFGRRWMLMRRGAGASSNARRHVSAGLGSAWPAIRSGWDSMPGERRMGGWRRRGGCRGGLCPRWTGFERRTEAGLKSGCHRRAAGTTSSGGELHGFCNGPDGVGTESHLWDPAKTEEFPLAPWQVDVTKERSGVRVHHRMCARGGIGSARIQVLVSNIVQVQVLLVRTSRISMAWPGFSVSPGCRTPGSTAGSPASG